MKIFRNPAGLQKWAKAMRRAGAKIALVPTMGYLHEGHLSLIAKAKAKGGDEAEEKADEEKEEKEEKKDEKKDDDI